MQPRFSRRVFGRTATLASVSAALGPANLRLNGLATAPELVINPKFVAFVQNAGGTAVIGQPLTKTFKHDGRTAQLFENFLLECHEHNQSAPCLIRPAALGRLVSGSRYFQKTRPFRSSAQVKYIWKTKHSLRFGFLRTWEQLGKGALLGNPISEEVPEAGGITAQYFEHGKLTYSPNRRKPVQISPIGHTYLAALANTTNASYQISPISPTRPGEAAQIHIELVNTGETVWQSSGEQAVWLGARWADSLSPKTREALSSVPLPHDVPPKGSATVKLDIEIPRKPGPYRLQPDLKTANDWFSSKAISAPIIATPARLEMPDVRVGLLDISDDNPGVTQATIFSTGGLRIHDEGGMHLAELGPTQRVVIRRDIPNEKHRIELPDGSKIDTAGKVLVSPMEESLLRLEETAPQRTYRGTMEFAWLPKYLSAWVVNILPMDDYLSGIVEQRDTIPWEALRASAIAFRTYGYTVRNERRARGNLFDVAASTYHTPTLFTRDQVYHGVARELSGTRLRDAIRDTRGSVMTYKNKTIHAVYFSRADGRTRNWHDVWGGRPKPWAMGVPDPYSVGHRLLGHGIGLPLRSANAMAADGAIAEEILTSYYTDIDFNHVY
ncbi:MAG: hypothetical protein CL790_03615 [Chloroflexi bacterium]|nr:hypothetical protein [Chloroflexota bacterium]HCU72521.1 hypothetical protein [Chloroflexota bacterium]